MTDRTPGEPGSQDFRETAERSQAANIADESASYVNAAPPPSEDLGNEVADGDVQVPEGMADDAQKRPDTTPDKSDSIEPFQIPGSAEDIHIAGETGPGPSG